VQIADDAGEKAEPDPASLTVRSLASGLRGVTSPRPSVKKVVPLR
jgi:hypothetical protein